MKRGDLMICPFCEKMVKAGGLRAHQRSATCQVRQSLSRIDAAGKQILRSWFDWSATPQFLREKIEVTLEVANTYKGGGNRPIFGYQFVGPKWVDMALGVCRSLAAPKMSEYEIRNFLEHLADTGNWRQLEVEKALGASMKDLVDRFIPVEVFYTREAA